MAHGTSAILALLMAILVFGTMQLFRNQLASSQAATIGGGFAGANVFIFLLTAVSNAEMEVFGSQYQSRLFPEVFGCLAIAASASAMVHRVSVTTCILFAVGLLYFASKAGHVKYSSTVGYAAPSVGVSKKKK